MTAGVHRSPRRKWAPAAVAGTAGCLCLSQAAVCALAGWAGWWRYGLIVALVLFEAAVALIAWALGYATGQEDSSAPAGGEGIEVDRQERKRRVVALRVGCLLCRARAGADCVNTVDGTPQDSPHDLRLISALSRPTLPKCDGRGPFFPTMCGRDFVHQPHPLGLPPPELGVT